MPPDQRTRLRRDLGALESYAALIGILVGAGVFKVTGDASARTGPSVILGFLVLAPAVFATSIAYVVFSSTSLGREPGGEYAHIAKTFGRSGLAFVGAWLKLIAYVGAAAYLAVALAGYLCELDAIVGLSGGRLRADRHGVPLACAGLLFFFAVHAFGVRWFGRLQVGMCVILGISIAVLVVPGLFAIDPSNYAPLFTHGPAGFAAALPPLFFAYAGFEALAHTGGEVRDSTARLPRVFVRGIAVTTLIFLSMSVVAFGVLPAARLEASNAPMAEVAARYLPSGGAAVVALGGVMAVATSLNATMLVPARLGIMLAADRLLPSWCGHVDPRTGTPLCGLLVTLALALVLVLTDQIGLALGIAVFALLFLYALHGTALLVLPRRNPELFAEVSVRVSRRLQVGATWFSIAAMLTLIAVQVSGDCRTMLGTDLRERLAADEWTTTELFVGWVAVGGALYLFSKRRHERWRRGAASG